MAPELLRRLDYRIGKVLSPDPDGRRPGLAVVMALTATILNVGPPQGRASTVLLVVGLWT